MSEFSTLYGAENVAVSSLEIDVPDWIEQDITCDTVAAILQGGCASGSYMPAVTYWQALETMSSHGDDVLEYLDDCGCDLPGLDGTSWAGLACNILSMAVEAWASSVQDELEAAIEELEERPVEWSPGDDGTMDTVVVIVCRWCEHQHEVRFDCEFAEDYRDESGCLDCDAFGEAISGEDFECPDCGRQA
jgi:hypothetical protein